MRQLLIAILLVFVGVQLNAQNLSFTCPRDTTLGCNVNCLTIQGVIPNLRGAGSDYTFNSVNNLSGCRTYDPPQTPGPSANITADDRYSDVITLPFSFPFYGTYYNQVVACGNGYLSFDVSLANAFANWDLSPNGTPVDFPSDLYDRALIASPFHDLDPSSTTSPSRQIKYQTIGIAPNRVWVLSYFRVPLYGTACANQIENTHQIALHESTGMIEVFIQDKEICTSWNDGRAMVGMQDWTQTKAIMPPGRRATDLPWGGQGINEVWRFYPRQGAPLFKKVELLNDAGVVLQTNTDTSRINSDLFRVSFPNVCPSSPSSMYVIRTTYAQISNPNATIFNLDTIYITQITSIPVTATPSATSCGSSNGSITVSANYGIPPFQYSLNGSAPQSSNVFNGLRSGIYTVNVTDSVNCSGSITVFVDSSNQLNASSSITAPTCSNRADGKITITPTGGLSPYQYTLISGSVTQPAVIQNGAYTFTNLSSGTYTVRIDDSLGCTRTFNNLFVDTGTSIRVVATSTSTCNGLANGTITVSPTTGTGPYLFSLNGYNGPAVPDGSQGTFSQLTAGSYTISIQDAGNCSGSIANVVVASNTSINASTSTTPASCDQASDGSITVNASGGTAPYQFTLRNQNDSVLSRSNNNVFSGLAPGNYRVTIIDSLGCSLDSILFAQVSAGIARGLDTSVTACSAFVWNGNVYTTSGVYSIDTANGFGCPYSDTIRLTINQGTFRSETQTACDRFIWNNRTYTNSGMHIYQYTNGQGCPSYDTLFLTINRSTSSTETVDACNNYTWRGNTYTTSGAFIDAGTNSSGCTRLDTLILTINTGTFRSESQSVCNSYTWNGTTYTTSGTYLRNYNNTNGCESTDTLYLTIRNSSTSSVSETKCNSFNWNGSVYTSSGTYSYTTTNAANCDSTITLNLIIYRSEQSTFDTTACNSFIWNGTTYTSSGIYTYNGVNSNGCDSIVTLNLTIDLTCRSNWNCQISNNPTNSTFEIKALSADLQTPVSVRIIDQSGRMLNQFSVSPNTARRVGGELGSGVYLIEFIQGNNRTVLRGVKQ
jgi:hypothetical protein